MCLKLALAATALSLIGAPALAAKAPAPAAPAAAPVVAPAPALAKATPEQRAEADRMDPLARAAFWSRETEADPRDTVAGVKLVKALRELGRYDEAVAQAEHILVIDPANVEALIEEARTRITQGQGFFAIDPAQRAAAAAPKDWRPQSLLAIALEQSQRDDEALAAHQRALALSPDNPAALSNLAMFYAAHGQSAQAEALLRRAVAQPGATAQIRQNLALILGLDGHLAEAEQLARRDLPPAMVDNNLAYLHAAQTQPQQRSWDSLRSQP
ncbi:MAG: tetratricopeptide repeat protein [Proteobacteria bacterium]|nr:tetratricopeptide repeat protein [Pseudomonadota bacterium]